MGFLIAALIRVADTNGGVNANNMWPSTVGCLVFDTPVCEELFFADWFVGHMGIFCAQTNGNHNWLVLRTALFISEAVSTISELKA